MGYGEQAVPVPYTPGCVPGREPALPVPGKGQEEKNHLSSCKRLLFLIKYRYGKKKYK